jgi:hypothetical protein
MHAGAVVLGGVDARTITRTYLRAGERHLLLLLHPTITLFKMSSVGIIPAQSREDADEMTGASCVACSDGTG